MGVLTTWIDLEHPLRGGDALVDPSCFEQHPADMVERVDVLEAQALSREQRPLFVGASDAKSPR
jgi:hypothetical protein